MHVNAYIPPTVVTPFQENAITPLRKISGIKLFSGPVYLSAKYPERRRIGMAMALSSVTRVVEEA